MTQYVPVVVNVPVVVDDRPIAVRILQHYQYAAATHTTRNALLCDVCYLELAVMARVISHYEFNQALDVIRFFLNQINQHLLQYPWWFQ